MLLSKGTRCWETLAKDAETALVAVEICALVPLCSAVMRLLSEPSTFAPEVNNCEPGTLVATLSESPIGTLFTVLLPT